MVLARTITGEKLLNLPVVEDGKVTEAFGIYWSLFEVALTKGDTETYVLTSLYSIKFTLKYGRHDHGAVAVTLLAMMLAGMEDYEAADRIGQAALKLSSQASGPIRAIALFGVSFYYSHWRHSHIKNLEIAMNAKRIIIETGNIPLLFFAFTTTTLTYLQCRLSLDVGTSKS
jgi:hypothetical protein